MIPFPAWGHEIYNFGKTFLVHHYYALCLSESCHRAEREDFLRNDVFTLYDLYGHAPAQEPAPDVIIFFNFSSPFLGHHHYILSLLEPCPRVEKGIFKQKYMYINFTLLTSELPSFETGHPEIYKFMSSYHIDATYKIW